MSAQEAILRLETAYRTQHNSIAEIGVFGNGLPEALITAAGAAVQHVHIAPDTNHAARVSTIAPVLEPFLDAHVRHFLHRLFDGQFNHLRAIIFCRDDAAALFAYQYALEIRRMGLHPADGPDLLIWNLVHKSTASAATFNRVQLDRLWQWLSGNGFQMPDAASIKAAFEAEALRAQALSRMQNLCMTAQLDGTSALRWRNAGRILPAVEHAALLDDAIQYVERTQSRHGLRIGLVGSMLPCPRTYAMIEQFGTILCDLQPLGTIWPLPFSDAPDPYAMLANAAADPFCPRTDPPARFVDAMVKRLVDARCDIVVAQVSQNDDSFGWDMPALRARLKAEGIDLIDLGFRDDYPNAAWLADASQRMKAVQDAPA